MPGSVQSSKTGDYRADTDALINFLTENQFIIFPEERLYKPLLLRTTTTTKQRAVPTEGGPKWRQDTI